MRRFILALTLPAACLSVHAQTTGRISGKVLNKEGKAIPGAKVKVEFEGEYGTEAGGEFRFTFQGPIEDALPVKDFLGPQYRAAVDRGLVATFNLSFANGLSLDGDAADKLTERLTQQSMGAAYVTASAEAQP